MVPRQYTCTITFPDSYIEEGISATEEETSLNTGDGGFTFGDLLECALSDNCPVQFSVKDTKEN